MSVYTKKRAHTEGGRPTMVSMRDVSVTNSALHGKRVGGTGEHFCGFN
jgi:hypothetical protein